MIELTLKRVQSYTVGRKLCHTALKQTEPKHSYFINTTCIIQLYIFHVTVKFSIYMYAPLLVFSFHTSIRQRLE